MTLRGVFVFSVFLSLCAVSSAQFNNTLISQKPKPIVTKSEMESDSAHYIDKPNTYRDKKANVVHSVWTEFDKYKSTRPQDSSYIMYSRMEGATKVWSKAIRLSKFPGDCSNSDSTLKADNPCIGPNGEIYICWAGPRGLAFQRSVDGGKNWMATEKILYPIKNGWDQEVGGIRTNGVPRLTCVTDTGEFKGRVYITWSDEKNGVNNKDVFLTYSDDKGDNWTEPILVTYRPNHKEQFNPAISVQPGTNNLFVTYFDRQNYSEGDLSDLYLARSKNGGLKFDYFKLNENPVMLDSSILSIRGLAFVPRTNDVKAIWSQTNSNNTLSIYSALIKDSTINEYLRKDSLMEMRVQKSFSFEKKISINYQMPAATKVTAVLTKPLESGLNKVVVSNVAAVKGQNTLVIDTKKLGLKKGNYTLTFYYNNRNTFVWITE